MPQSWREMSSIFRKFFRIFRSSLRFRLAGLFFAGVADFVEHHAADDTDADGGPCADNYCYPLNEDELIINIKTGYDVKEVNIILGDPFAAGILGGGETWNGDKQPIIFKKKLKHQIWWTTTVKPPFKRLKYYFELITEDERWFYFEDGFVSAEQMALEGRSRQCFVFPWMNPCETVMKRPSRFERPPELPLVLSCLPNLWN